MDEWEVPATLAHIRLVEERLSDMDAALRRIEQREDETWAYRTQTYAWLRELHGRRGTWWIVAAVVLGFILGRS